MKLDFVIIGGMKCGSTALGEYFRIHPDVNFCNLIETDYFSGNFQNIKSLDDYFRIYYALNNNGLKGESSPTYSYLNHLPQTANKLKKYFPEIKIILIVRNPFNRISSHINHQKLENVNINSKILTHLKEYPDIIEKTKFGAILEQYLQVFNFSDIKIIRFDSILSNNGLNELCEFLGIKDYQQNLPEANKTDKRYHTLPIINLYKRNYLRFSNIPGWKFIKRPLKSVMDNILSKKLRPEDFCKLDQESKFYIEEKLKDDDILFESLAGFNYMNLSK